MKIQKERWQWILVPIKNESKFDNTIKEEVIIGG